VFTESVVQKDKPPDAQGEASWGLIGVRVYITSGYFTST